jgi:hypothetical protein
MVAGTKRATATQQALVIGGVFFVAYLLTRTRDLGGDDTVFAMAVDGFLSGGGPTREVFHPHHALFNPLVVAVCWLLRLVGLHPFVADVGAAIAALFAAAVAGGLVPLLRQAGLTEGPALLTAAVAGASGGLWQYGTRMEVYALATAAVLLWLAVVGRGRPGPLSAGASLVASMLGHLATTVLLVPTAIRFRKRPAALATAVAVGVGLTAVGLIAMFVLVDHAYTPRQWLRVVAPGHGDDYLAPPRPPGMARALAGLVLWRWYDRVPVFSDATSRWLDLAGGLAVALLLVALVAGALSAVRDRHPLAVTAALGIAAYVPLWLVWDVGNPEHAVAAIPLFAALVAFGAAKLPRRIGSPALGAVLVLLLLVNGLASAVPQSRVENSRECVIASFVSATLPEDAVLLAVGIDPALRLSLPYLSGRRVVTLTLDVDSARTQGLPPAEGLAYWLRAGRAARSVWVTPDVLDPSTATWMHRLGIPPAAWTRFVAAIRPGQRAALPLDGVVIREPFVLTEITLAD